MGCCHSSRLDYISGVDVFFMLHEARYDVAHGDRNGHHESESREGEEVLPATERAKEKALPRLPLPRLPRDRAAEGQARRRDDHLRPFARTVAGEIRRADSIVPFLATSGPARRTCMCPVYAQSQPTRRDLCMMIDV